MGFLKTFCKVGVFKKKYRWCVRVVFGVLLISWYRWFQVDATSSARIYVICILLSQRAMIKDFLILNNTCVCVCVRERERDVLFDISFV